MRKITATVGSAVFVMIAPGVAARLVRWWLGEVLQIMAICTAAHELTARF
jgi:hypothetical protein